ncbi:MAG: hypothetical protein ACT4OM_13505 [Actinomycetota bacterium]
MKVRRNGAPAGDQDQDLGRILAGVRVGMALACAVILERFLGGGLLAVILGTLLTAGIAWIVQTNLQRR